MILPENSIIRNPPTKIDPQLVTIFNAIRFSFDICEISHYRLLKNLNNLTEKDAYNHNEFPEIFLDVWSIINNSVVFKKIIANEFKINDNHPNLQEIKKAIFLRDSNQHLDERLTHVYKTESFPVFGSLSWRKNYYDSNEVRFTTIYSGNFTHKEEISMSISNNVDVELDNIIQQIIFTSIARRRRGSDFYYEEEKISINKIISDLIVWANHLEGHFKEQFKNIDISNRHKSDLCIKLFCHKI